MVVGCVFFFFEFRISLRFLFLLNFFFLRAIVITIGAKSYYGFLGGTAHEPVVVVVV